jgi:predicted dehydrogenase
MKRSPTMEKDYSDKNDLIVENVALIGYGYWGKKIYKYLQESNHFNLNHVYFPSLERIKRSSPNIDFGKEFVSSINQIWEDKGTPHVIIATPINTHFQLAHEALLSSKNVLVEKPLSTTLKEAILLKNIASKRKLNLITEYTYTFSNGLLYAKSLIDEDVIGSIKSISITIKQLGRFLDYDVYTLLGTHALSILDIFIPLNECMFTAQPLLLNDKIVTGGLISFKDKASDCSGYIDVTLHCPEREKKVIIYGERGTIIYNPNSDKTLKVILYNSGSKDLQEELVSEQNDHRFDENHNLRNAIIAFWEIVSKQKEDNIERAVAITAVLESLYINPGQHSFTPK